MPARLSPFSAFGKRPARLLALSESQSLAQLLAPLLALAACSSLGLAGLASASPAAKAPPALDPAFVALLKTGNLETLTQACQSALSDGNAGQLRLLQQRLLTIKPAPQPLPVVLANADGLLRCQAPDLALQVLARYAPAPGPERTFWLVMQWRAAAAGLHHDLAAQALQLLAAGKLPGLEARQLPLKQKDDGTLVTRSALDLLAAHLESLGRNREAAEVLLASQASGALQAERYARAVALLDRLPLSQRQRLMELALEQAAASGSWGLVAQLLDQELALEASPSKPASQAMQRRLRLSGRIDDAYGEWQARRRAALGSSSPVPDATNQGRLAALEGQLRSPRAPGGHAAAPQPAPSPSASSPFPSAPQP